jgi:hypothetical protein
MQTSPSEPHPTSRATMSNLMKVVDVEKKPKVFVSGDANCVSKGPAFSAEAKANVASRIKRIGFMNLIFFESSLLFVFVLFLILSLSYILILNFHESAFCCFCLISEEERKGVKN